MVTRVEWLDAGLDLLATEGAPAVTIERLTGELGVTKGSYYHHFKSAGGYKTALLEYFEAQFTARLIEEIEREPGVKPAAQERVDRARTAYLMELCRGLNVDGDPDRFAQLLYLILIGAEQVLPPITKDDLRDIYAMTLRLAAID